MNPFIKFQTWLRYKKAVAEANNLYLQSGKRYFVMPTFGKGRQLVIIDRGNFRLLKRKHYINKDARVFDLINECFYHTPYFNGQGALPQEQIKEKKKALYLWADTEYKRGKYQASAK